MHCHRSPSRLPCIAKQSVFLLALVVAAVGSRSSAMAQQRASPANTALAAPATAPQAPAGLSAGNAAIGSLDVAGTWRFTPAGRAMTSIAVPGGGWYKQGFTDVTEAVYARSITVPDAGQPQATWIEFGAVNHEA